MESRISLPPGVRIFERGWLSSNNVVFADGAKTAIVDTGYCTHSPHTLALLVRALEGRPLDLIVNTHLHSDHCGGNAELQARYSEVQTYIPPGEAAAVREWDEEKLSYRKTGQSCPRFAFDGLLLAGDELVLGDRPWQIHAAPGHDPHSIILFEPQSRTLISADALWRDGFGIVFPELASEPGFDDVAATLSLIESLDPASVIPGHGPMFVEVSDALVAARSRLAAYRASPKRHATHAMKVLLKFKLLELQAVPLDDFIRWACETPYFGALFARYFADQDESEWLASLLDGLVRARAASVTHGRLVNL